MPDRNLLFISHRFPYPLTRGEKIRGYNLIRHMAASFNVYLGAIVDDPAEFAYLDELRRHCAEVVAFGINKQIQKAKAVARIRAGRPLMLDYYRHPGLHAWTDVICARTRMDVLYIYCTAMAPYALHLQGRRKILDMQDVDSEKWALYAQESRLPMSAVWRREARTLLAYERKAAMACDVTLLVTRQEAEHFAALAPEASGKIDWVENGVDLEAFSPARGWQSPFPTPGPHLVFTGAMDYRPNSDAVRWFARNVLPRVRASVPSASFWIVGANPGAEVTRLAEHPGVFVTGRVAEVQPYIAHAAACVCPLRMARGIQNKVLEAMAMGRPVIASPQAFEGVRAEPGRDLLVAEGETDFADTVISVLQGRRPRLGEAARAAMERNYAWSATLARLDRHLHS